MQRRLSWRSGTKTITRNRSFPVFFVVAGLLFGSTAQSFAQGGIAIDGDGIVSLRQSDRTGKLGQKRIKQARDGREQQGLRYVSLPRLLDRVQKTVESGQPITIDDRTLGGLVSLRYIFVYPEEKDLVIAGPVEGVDATDTARPVGTLSGRPTLRLEDLVVALRTVGPGKRGGDIGCSIDLPQDTFANMQAAAMKLGPVPPSQSRRAVSTMVRAVGKQSIRIFQVPPDTPFATVLVEADYLLKRFTMGLAKVPVAGIPSFLSQMRTGDPVYNRWWFAPQYEPLVVSDDGLAFELAGPRLRILASNSQFDNNTPATRTTEYADRLTERIEDLCAAVPAWADLANLADLTVLATLVRQDRLAERAGWDLAWVLDPAGFPVEKRPEPKFADTLGNSLQRGQIMHISVGGVQFAVDDYLRPTARIKDDEQVTPHRRRPSEGYVLDTAMPPAPPRRELPPRSTRTDTISSGARRSSASSSENR